MVVQIIRLLFSSIWRVTIGVGWVEKGVFCIQAPLSIKWLTDMNTTNIKKETLCKHKLHKPNIYMLRKMFYSSSKRSDSCIWVFLQLMPWHSLQIIVHLSPCLRMYTSSFCSHLCSYIKTFLKVLVVPEEYPLRLA